MNDPVRPDAPDTPESWQVEAQDNHAIDGAAADLAWLFGGLTFLALVALGWWWF